MRDLLMPPPNTHHYLKAFHLHLAERPDSAEPMGNRNVEVDLAEPSVRMSPRGKGGADRREEYYPRPCVVCKSLH